MGEYHDVRNSAVTIRLGSIQEDGNHTLTVEGLAGEELRGVRHIMQHGLYSRPPAGSLGTGIVPGGRRDLLMALGVDTPKLRPKGIPNGGTALYDQHGNIIKLIGAGGAEMTVKGPYKIKVGKLEIEADSVVIKSSDINLGGTGGKPVKLSDDSAATTTKAV